MNDNKKEYNVVEVEKYNDLIGKEEEEAKLKRKLIFNIVACGAYSLALILDIVFADTFINFDHEIQKYCLSGFLAAGSLKTILRIIQVIIAKSELKNVDLTQITNSITENKNQGLGK